MNAMVDNQVFRAAMSRLGAAVNVLTTDGPAGRHGMTASAVCSLSDEPASLLVCINRNARMNEVLRTNGVLCVNVLAGGHEALSGTFASRSVSMDDRFAQAEWTEMENGTPALADALASFACGIEGVQEFGTHSVFICGVESLEIRERAEGLVYFGRSYHRLPLEQGCA